MKHILSNCHLALNRYTWRHNEVLKALTEKAKKQAEEGKYAPKPLKQGLGKIEFVPQGGKVPDRKKADKTMVSQSTVTWEIAADLKGCERFFPIPTTKKPDLVIWSEEEKRCIWWSSRCLMKTTSVRQMSGKRIATRLLWENVRRQGGKQCISRSKLAAQDTSQLASQSGREWQDFTQRKETS